MHIKNHFFNIKLFLILFLFVLILPATSHASTVPGKPTNVVATLGAQQTVTLSFTPPSDGGSAILSYGAAYYESCTGQGQAIAGVDVADLPVTLIGAPVGTPICFTLAAHNAIGDGTTSDPSNTVTPAEDVPSAPQALSTNPGNGQITLTWSAPSYDGVYNNPGGVITGYEVQYKLSSDNSWTTFETTPSDLLTSTVTELTEGESYDFQIIAQNAAGDSLPSDPVTDIPNAPTAPSTISSLLAIGGNHNATVSFTPPTSVGGRAIDHYTITSTPGNHTGTGTDTPIIVSGLTNGTAYSFKVTATNSIGTSTPSVASNTISPGTGVFNATSLLGQVSGNTPVWDASGTNNTSGSVNSQGFDTPQGVAVDSVNHRLFVADNGNGRVMVFNLDSNNQISSKTATHTLGDMNLSATPTYRPVGLAFDATNERLFVVDSSYPRVLVFNVNPSTMTDDESATNSIGDPAISGTPLSVPFGVAYDSDHERLFVADNSAIGVFIFNANPGTMTDNESASTEFTHMQGPWGIAYDPTNQRIFVADNPSASVLVFDANIDTLDGAESPSIVLAPSLVTLSSPVIGLAYDDSTDTLFLTDAHNRVLFFDTTPATFSNTTNPKSIIGQNDFDAIDANTTQSGLSGPSYITYDSSSGAVFISDTTNNRVMQYNFAHIVGTLASATPGTPYSQTVETTTGPGNNVFSISQGTLATGLSLDSSTGAISGTPSSGGSTHFTVTVTNALPVGVFTNSKIFLALIPTLPDAPTGVTATPEDKEVSVAFTPPTYNGGATITNYTVTSSPGGFTAHGTTSPLLVTGLTNGVNYTFTVKATNSIGDSVASDPSSVVAPYNIFGTYVATSTLGVPNTTSTTKNLIGFNNPNGVALDTVDHRLFVSDINNKRVMVFPLDSNNAISSHSATYEFNLDSNDSTTGGLAYDSVNKRLFIERYSNQDSPIINTILVYDANPSTMTVGESHINTLAAGLTSGNIGGLAFDPDNQRLFVSDTGNQNLDVFDVAPNTISDGESPTITISLHSLHFQDENVDLEQLAYDSVDKRIFIVNGQNGDTGSGVLVFNADPNTMNNNETILHEVGVGLLSTGLAYDSSSKYLFSATAQSSNNSHAYAFDANPSTMTDNEIPINTLGFSNQYVIRNTLLAVGAMTLDTAHHRLFITEQIANRVDAYNVDPATITDYENPEAELGHYTPDDQPLYSNISANNGTALPNSIDLTRGTVIDTVNHRLFVADNQGGRVLVFPLDSNNAISSTCATYVLGKPNLYSREYTLASQNGLRDPNAIALDASTNRLFVTDYSRSRIMIFDVNPATMTSGENALNVLGQSDFTTNNNSNNPEGFNDITGLAFDPATERLFATNRGTGKIKVFDVSLAHITNGESPINILTSSVPYTLAFDSVNNRLFSSEISSNRIHVFDVAPNTINNNETSLYVLGQPDFNTSTSSTTQAGLYSPVGVAVDSTGNTLFVVDNLNNRLVSYDVTPGTISNGEPASGVLGQTDFLSNTNGSSLSKFHTPTFVSYDSVGHRLFVSDDNNGRIMQFDLVTITTTDVPGGTTGTAYSATVNIANSQNTVIFSVSSGTLPTGLSLSSSTGVISGTPTAAGTYLFTIQVNDQGFFDTKNYSVVITASSSDSGGHTLIVSGGGGGGGGGGSTPPAHVTPVVIPGCNNGTSGFSPVTGQSCINNKVVLVPTKILGCGDRTTGFSSTSGESCVNNVVSNNNTNTNTNTSNTNTNTNQSNTNTPSNTSSSAYNFGPTTLRNGSTGDAVKELQRYLNDTMNLGLVLDGKLGPKTIAVIKKWQKAHNLVSDGLIGAKTKALMNSLVKKK